MIRFFKRQIIKKENLQILEMLHRAFAENLGTNLSVYMRKTCEVSFENIEITNYGKFINGLSNNFFAATIYMDPIKTNNLLAIDKSLVYQFIDRLAGGEGNAGSEKPMLTDIEENILEDIIYNLLRSLKIAWQNILDLRPTIGHINSFPDRILMADDKEEVVVTKIKVIFDDKPYSIYFTLFSICIKDILFKLTPKYWHMRTSKSKTDKKKIDNIKSKSMDIEIHKHIEKISELKTSLSNSQNEISRLKDEINDLNDKIREINIRDKYDSTNDCNDKTYLTSLVIKKWINTNQIKKASILMIALGEKIGSKVVSLLTRYEVITLLSDVDKIEMIKPEEKAEIVAELEKELLTDLENLYGGFEYTREIIKEVFGDKLGKELYQYINEENRKEYEKDFDHFEFVRECQAPLLYHLIKDELPQIVAIIIKCLGEEKGSEVLDLFPHDIKNVVSKKLKSINISDCRVMNEINNYMESRPEL